MIKIYTIGHSAHPLDRFMEILACHDIAAVVDVRTYPSSRHHPQYNRPLLEKALTEAGVEYHWAGSYLGGKREESLLHTQEDHLTPESVLRDDRFLTGLDRLVQIASNKKTAILCAEEDPYKCHRTYLIAEGLRKWPNVHIHHIRRDARLELHHRPSQLDLFEAS